jgi:hypothetical protein
MIGDYSFNLNPLEQSLVNPSHVISFSENPSNVSSFNESSSGEGPVGVSPNNSTNDCGCTHQDPGLDTSRCDHESTRPMTEEDANGLACCLCTNGEVSPDRSCEENNCNCVFHDTCLEDQRQILPSIEVDEPVDNNPELSNSNCESSDSYNEYSSEFDELSNPDENSDNDFSGAQYNPESSDYDPNYNPENRDNDSTKAHYDGYDSTDNNSNSDFSSRKRKRDTDD